MFKRLFFRLCYHLGFYPTRIKPPGEVFAYLKSQPRVVREYELSRLSYTVALAQDHRYYRDLLVEFVPNWKAVKIKKPVFIGEGYGRSSLDAYRYVEIEEKTYFEKVYFTDHLDLKRIKWVQENVAEMISKKIVFPRIQKLYPGDVLTVVYFNFLTLEDKEAANEQGLIAITQALYLLSEKQTSHLSIIKQPAFIRNFDHHHQYSKYMGAAQEELLKEGMETAFFERAAKSSKRVLTHGDLQKTNVYKENVVLDWDSFGMYPIGLEVAFLFFRLVFKENKEAVPENWLEEKYKPIITQADWEDFKRNFIYFLFVFSMELFLRGEKRSLQSSLIESLRSYS